MPLRPVALLLGEVPESLGKRLADEGVVVKRGQGWLDAGPGDGVSVLVTASHVRITAPDLDRLPQLRVVARSATGTDNIDLPELERRGLAFVHAPEANAQSAAELTMALLFATARRLTFHDLAMHDGGWSRNEMLGTELFGKRLGIIGLGRVGSRVARMAGSIRMKCGAYDPYIPGERFSEFSCKRYGTLDALLERSDVLSLHCPLTPITKGMIGIEQLAMLPAGAIVLNVARGEIVDETALAQLLASGQLRAAGIDCWSVEPPPADHPLLALPPDKLVATPHLGARTPEARERAGVETAVGILAKLGEMGVK